MGKLLFGVGINDADYVVQPSVAKKRTICPYYQTWRNLLYRCYSPKMHAKNPTYTNCTVSDDWLTAKFAFKIVGVFVVPLGTLLGFIN